MAEPTSREPRQTATPSEPPVTDHTLRTRLDALKADLGEAVADDHETHSRKENDGSTGRALGTGMRVAAELVSGTLVGAAIGYFVDQFAGSSPFGLLGFLLVGIAAGFRNIYRMGMAPTSPKPSEPKQ
jgi:ATP synthase protein I